MVDESVYVLVIGRRVFHDVGQADIDSLEEAIRAGEPFADVTVGGTTHRVHVGDANIGWAVNRTGRTPGR
jgi:hypothetical protein